jgi:hypothetical protein
MLRGLYFVLSCPEKLWTIFNFVCTGYETLGSERAVMA